MKRFEVFIPLIAGVYIEVEAEEEDEAIETASRMFDRGEVDTEGHDPEPENYWEATEVKEI